MQRQGQNPNEASSSVKGSPWAASVSAFNSASDTRGSTMSLLTAVRYATGESQKSVVLAIRRARSVALARADDKGLEGKARATLLKKSTENLKRGLWGFTPTGVYSKGRKADQAAARTEAVMVEADHVGGPEEARACVRRAAKDPSVMAAWISPSGDGVKVLVWTRGGSSHAQRHAFVTDCIFGVGGCLEGIEDDSCYRNEHLLCFGSYDPGAHIRTKDLAPLEVPSDFAVPATTKAPRADERGAGDETDSQLDVAEMVGILKHIPPDCRTNPDLSERKEGEVRDQWLRIGMAIHSQMPGADGLALWDRWSRGGYGTAALLGETPDNYDAAALRTSWKSFSGDDVSWATAVRLGRQWEKAEAARDVQRRSEDSTTEAGTEAAGEDAELGTNPDVLEVIHFLAHAYFAQRGVRVLATGECAEAEVSTVGPAKRIAVEIRRKFKMSVSTSVCQDAVDVEQARLASLRMQQLKEDIVGAPHGTDAGKHQLRRWLKAVTGGVSKLDEAVMLHILRNMKLKMLGKPAVDHKALVLFQLQRSGKSTAITRLLGPVHELAYWAHSLKQMVDERGVRRFGVMAAIVWDEMAGARGRESDEYVDTLKALATGNEVVYRPLGTNTDKVMVNTATLFCTTNRPVAEVIRDPTGNRRFWQITTLPQIDWAAINDIDYDTLWTAIGVKDVSPLKDKEVDKAVMAQHHATRHKDVVEQWTESEGWGELKDVLPPGSKVLTDLPAVRGAKWYATTDLYTRFCVWCAGNGERPVSAVWFGRRLAGLGWEARRARSGSNARAYGYEAPIYL